MTCNDKVTTKLVAKFKAVVTHYKATTSDEPNWFVVQFGNAIDTLAGDFLKQIRKFCRYIHLIYLDLLAPGSWVAAPSSDCTKNFMTGWTLFCWEGSLKRKKIFLRLLKMHEHVVLKVARKNSLQFICEKEIPIVCLVSSASRRLTFFSASVQLCRLLCKKTCICIMIEMGLFHQFPSDLFKDGWVLAMKLPDLGIN